MGGNYEEVNKETKQEIMKSMTSTPNLEQASKDLGRVIPIIYTRRSRKTRAKDTPNNPNHLADLTQWK